MNRARGDEKIIDLHPRETAPRPATRTSRRLGCLGPLAAWMLSCLVLPIVALQVKRSAGGSNVDDYLYAFFALEMGSPLDPRTWLDTGLHSGQISPLMPALASLTPTDATPYMATVPQLALLSLLFWSARAIARHLGEPHPTLWALTATAFPAMIAWTAMFHFAVASTALLAACVWAYLASDAFTKCRPTLLFGLVFGALTLSRTVALVYVAALGVALTWHLLRQRPGRDTARGLASAGAVAVVVAGPWWIVSGETVFHYLIGAGYDSSSGFAPDESLVERVASRVTHTFAEWGWPVVTTLAVLAVMWAISLAYARARPTTHLESQKSEAGIRRMLLSLGVVGIAILASSSNSGTAFSLPLAPLLILGIASGSRPLRANLPPRLTLAITTALAALTLALSTVSIHPQAADTMRLTNSWHRLLHDAGWVEGSKGPEDIHEALTTTLGGQDVILARDDALLNANGLMFTGRYIGPSLGEIRLAPFSQTDWTPTSEELRGAIVISGQSPGNYHQVNPDQLAAHLEAIDYSIACDIQIGARNTIVLWAPPSTQLTCPPDLQSTRRDQ